MIVADRGIGGISQIGTIDRIAKNFTHTTVSGNDRNSVSFIGVGPNISRNIQSDAIPSFDYRVSHQDIAQAERVIRKCTIAAGRAFEIAAGVEFHPPYRPASGIDYKHRVAVMVKSDTVGNEILRASRNSCIGSSHARIRNYTAEGNAVIHRLYAKNFFAIYRRRSRTIGSRAGYFPNPS